MAELLKNTEYGDAYASDLEKTDDFGNTADNHVNMYNSMFSLDYYYKDYQSANVAKYWRIRTEITQWDTALNTKANFALDLKNYGSEVDYETVWGKGRVEAERMESSAEKCIGWVNECLK